MTRSWSKLATVALVGASLACGNTESNKPQAPPSSSGGAAGGSAGGGTGGGSGGGGGSAGAPPGVHVCHSGTGESFLNPRTERLQFQGNNGTFEDHCDDSGKLVEYGCASAPLCTPTPKSPCSGDLGVPYNTGAVSESTVDCPCSEGVCPLP